MSRSPRSGAPSAVTTVNCGSQPALKRWSFENSGDWPASSHRVYRAQSMEMNQKASVFLEVRVESVL